MNFLAVHNYKSIKFSISNTVNHCFKLYHQMTLHTKFVFAYHSEDIRKTLKQLIPSCWKKSQLSHDTKHLWFVLKLRVLKYKIKLG